jgi:hypothetical protein
MSPALDLITLNQFIYLSTSLLHRRSGVERGLVARYFLPQVPDTATVHDKDAVSPTSKQHHD